MSQSFLAVYAVVRVYLEAFPQQVYQLILAWEQLLQNRHLYHSLYRLYLLLVDLPVQEQLSQSRLSAHVPDHPARVTPAVLLDHRQVFNVFVGWEQL